MSPFTMSSERRFTEWNSCITTTTNETGTFASLPRSSLVLLCSPFTAPGKHSSVFCPNGFTFPSKACHWNHTGCSQMCLASSPCMVLLKSPMSLSISSFLLQNAQSHSIGRGITICVEGGNCVVSSFWNAGHCTDIYFPISWVYTLGVRLLGHMGRVRLAL